MSKTQKKDTADYLIAEFNMLHQRATLQEQIIANKINFFVAITTAIIGGILLSAENRKYSDYIIYVAPLLLLFLFGIGRTTLSQIVDLYMSSLLFYRRAGRIRKWFLDNDKNLKKYIPFTIGDDTPKFYTDKAKLRGIEAILLLVNSAVASITAVSISWLVYSLLLSNLVSFEMIIIVLLIISLLSFLVAFQSQVKYVKQFLITKEKTETDEGKIFFPKHK